MNNMQTQQQKKKPFDNSSGGLKLDEMGNVLPNIDSTLADIDAALKESQKPVIVKVETERQEIRSCGC